MEYTALENYRKYSERIDLYKNFGYDIEKEREFIIEKSQPLYGNILEVGTGKGYLAVALAKKGHNFTTVDISRREQEFARLNIQYLNLERQVNFKIENAENLSFENGSFDVVFSVNMIHHLASPSEVIDELTRVTSCEGKIILSDFSQEGLEVIDKVHKSEGRRHPASKANLSDIGDYLVSKDFSIKKYRSSFQEILIAQYKIK